jgi:hypothetical protein
LWKDNGHNLRDRIAKINIPLNNLFLFTLFACGMGDFTGTNPFPALFFPAVFQINVNDWNPKVAGLYPYAWISDKKEN